MPCSPGSDPRVAVVWTREDQSEKQAVQPAAQNRNFRRPGFRSTLVRTTAATKERPSSVPRFVSIRYVAPEDDRHCREQVLRAIHREPNADRGGALQDERCDGDHDESNRWDVLRDPGRSCEDD